MSRWLKCTSMYFNTDWNKYDDRLMKAVERSEVDKVASVLSKKGVNPTKLDVEGRSAFHLAAARGHLECLNLLLGHHVDVTATDATGKNALHLAARNGHSLCVQKLLQHNCPVGNVDLQGRTALHDAVMAGCASSVKLLCDSGAAVNTSDFDGRTPLVLATQMCHPRICQLLLERGADISVRDKQNKTALILGCEYACKDAVEVLLKAGADVLAVDGFGHDGYHYSRLCKNPELVALVKSAVETASKAKEAAKLEHMMRQSLQQNAEAEAKLRDQIIHDLERKNESQQETLRKFHQEQRVLVDKVNRLQHQLSQEKSTNEDMQKEREQLKLLLSVREKDEGAKVPDTVKVQHKGSLGEYPGQSVIKGKDLVLVKQSHSLDSAQVLEPSSPLCSLSRPLELSKPGLIQTGDAEKLCKELEAVKKKQEAAEEEVHWLKATLATKSQECEKLVQGREAAEREADRQVQELEQALSDVQKRMLDSETKVKQLQSHVVAVKEHLSSQLVEDLRAQLQEIKGKYEGASSEVGRLRNHLKQSEKALEEYKKSEGQLAVETERLSKELEGSRKDREEMTLTLVDMESLVKEMEVQQASMVPGEKFDNMKNLLTNAVDEKERQLAELREDYDRVLEEVAELHRELDSQRGRAEKTLPLQEHERVKGVLEEQNMALKKRLADVTSKSQVLILDLEESEEEKEVLRKRLQEVNKNIQVQYVPLKSHEELKRTMNRTMEELHKQLAEVTQKSSQDKVELQKLQVEKATLCENVTNLKSNYVSADRFVQEVGAISDKNEELKKELEELQRRYQDQGNLLAQSAVENESLKKSLKVEFVPKGDYEKVKHELSGVVEQARTEVSNMEVRYKASQEELRKMSESSAALNLQLECAKTTMEQEYVSYEDHEAMKVKLNSALLNADARAREAVTKYQLAQEETKKLHMEVEEQKKELDMIQEAIQSKFVPANVLEEKVRSFTAIIEDSKGQLLELEGKCVEAKKEAECLKEEKEKLEADMESMRNMMGVGYVSNEKYLEVESICEGRVKELEGKLADLGRQHQEVETQRVQLEKKNVQLDKDVQRLRQEMQEEWVPRAEFEVVQESVQVAREEFRQAEEALKKEMEKTVALEKELEAHRGDGTLLEEYCSAQKALQQEVVRLNQALQDEQEANTQKGEDVASLQSELLEATQALEERRSQEAGETTSLREKRLRLEEELGRLVERCQQLEREVKQAKEGEGRALGETETLKAKSVSIEGEIRELQRRYDDSLGTIGELQKRIQMSSNQTEMKDKKISELLADVERLKQALNGLSQLAYTGGTPNKRHSQHIDALQAQVKSLQQQLADAERQHREVVSIYRTHLLSAAQGHMDEDVQAALLQIIRMRQQFVC